MKQFISAAWLAGVAACLIVASCAAQSASDVRRDALSRQAFEAILPILQELKPNDSLLSLQAQQTVYEERRGTGRVPFVVMPGWISDLSGGVLGGLTFLGGVAGRSGDKLFGTHIFGWVRQEGIVIPRFLVSTEATLISDTEYSRLKAEGTKGAGFAFEPGSGRHLYFRDLHVRETRALSFADELAGASVTLKPARVADVREWLLSERSFQEIEEKLRSLAPGTSFWDVLAKLGALVTTRDSDGNHMWQIRGYLASERFPIQYLSSESGYYSIWPFGYVKGKQEVPRLVLVFKNNQLLRVSPFTGNWKVSEYVAE